MAAWEYDAEVADEQDEAAGDPYAFHAAPHGGDDADAYGCLGDLDDGDAVGRGEAACGSSGGDAVCGGSDSTGDARRGDHGVVAAAQSSSVSSSQAGSPEAGHARSSSSCSDGDELICGAADGAASSGRVGGGGSTPRGHVGEGEGRDSAECAGNIVDGTLGSGGGVATVVAASDCGRSSSPSPPAAVEVSVLCISPTPTPAAPLVAPVPQPPPPLTLAPPPPLPPPLRAPAASSTSTATTPAWHTGGGVAAPVLPTAAAAATVGGRVIMHLDLDAFYAQVEMVRLGVPRDLPLAVQQWGSLIAINYPARKYGISRRDSAASGLAKCPSLRLVHVETLDFDGGTRDDGVAAAATDKVSLRRYRLASQHIFKLLLRVCGAGAVEKASVDEAFVDLTPLVDAYLGSARRAGSSASAATTAAATRRAGCIVDAGSGGAARPWCGRPAWADNEAADRTAGGDGEDSAAVPRTPLAAAAAAVEALAARRGVWHVLGRDGEEVRARAGGDGEGAAGACQAEYAAVVSDLLYDGCTGGTAGAASRLAVGAVIADYLRYTIWRELGYTSSAGIAPNKMLAKLGSARNKPNQQTLFPPAAIGAYMASLPLQKIRFLGGKMGAKSVALVQLHRRLAGPTARPPLPPPPPSAAAGSAGDDGSDDDAAAADEEDDDGSGSDDGDGGGRGHKPGGSAPTGAAPAYWMDATVTAGDAQALPLAALVEALGDKGGAWAYRIVRGLDDSPITPRCKPKSMMAAKSLGTKPPTFGAAARWLHMLAAEVASRMVEDASLWDRHPRTLVLHVDLSTRAAPTGVASRSLSCPMPAGATRLPVLHAAACALLKRAMVQRGAAPTSDAIADATPMFPCIHLALGATNFEDHGGAGQRTLAATMPAAAAPSSRHGVESSDDVGQPTPPAAAPAPAPAPRSGSIAAAFARHAHPNPPSSPSSSRASPPPPPPARKAAGGSGPRGSLAAFFAGTGAGAGAKRPRDATSASASGGGKGSSDIIELCSSSDDDDEAVMAAR